jgi:hypothetical protein
MKTLLQHLRDDAARAEAVGVSSDHVLPAGVTLTEAKHLLASFVEDCAMLDAALNLLRHTTECEPREERAALARIRGLLG